MKLLGLAFCKSLVAFVRAVSMALGEAGRIGSPITVLFEVTEAGMREKPPVSRAVSWRGMFDGKGPS